MRTSAQVLGILVGLALATTASAAPISIIYTGFASGTLAGDAFGNSAFTITGIADTDDVFATGTGWRVSHSSATIDIDGLGALVVSTETSTAVNNVTGFAIFGNVQLNLALYVQGSHPSFATWDLKSSIGPFDLASNTLQWASGFLDTSGGDLFLETQTGVGTFEAILVPAPASIAALASIGVIGARRRR